MPQAALHRFNVKDYYRVAGIGGLHDGDSAAPASFPDAVIEVSKLLRH